MKKRDNLNGEKEVAAEKTHQSCNRFAIGDQKRANVVRIFQHVSGAPANNVITHALSSNGSKNKQKTKRDVEVDRGMLRSSKFGVQGTSAIN